MKSGIPLKNRSFDAHCSKPEFFCPKIKLVNFIAITQFQNAKNKNFELLSENGSKMDFSQNSRNSPKTQKITKFYKFIKLSIPN